MPKPHPKDKGWYDPSLRPDDFPPLKEDDEPHELNAAYSVTVESNEPAPVETTIIQYLDGTHYLDGTTVKIQHLGGKQEWIPFARFEHLLPQMYLHRDYGWKKHYRYIKK